MPHHENKKHKHKHRRRDEEHHSRKSKKVKNPTPKKTTKPKERGEERQRGERWTEAETAACMLSAIRNRGELKAKIPMGGKSAQQLKEEAYQKVLFDTNAESNTLRVMKEIRDKLSKFPSKSKKKFSVLRGLMRQTGGGAISESKKMTFAEVLSLIYISEESVSGIPEVAASAVLEGEREKTPPRDEFYSKNVTTSQLRDIRKCQLMAQNFTTKTEKSSRKKKGATPKVEKSSKSSGKRKAPPSTSSSSSSDGDNMSLYSDEDSGGSSTSRSSSRSSRTRSTSSSTSSGNEIFSTAPVSGQVEAEPDDESDVSHISPSQTPTKKRTFGLYSTAGAEASFSEPPLEMSYSEGNRSVSEEGSFVVPRPVPGKAADSKGPQAGTSKPDKQSTPKEKTRPKGNPPVTPTVDACCEKLHETLRVLTTELVTNMRVTRDQTERTTQAVENFVKSQGSIAQAFRDMADVLVGARYGQQQPPPQPERQNPAAAQQGQRTPSPPSSSVPKSQDKSCQQGSPYNTAPTHTEETAQEPSPPKMTTDEAVSKQEALDIERAIEVSLLEAQDVLGPKLYENTPPETAPIVIGDDEGHNERGQPAQVATSSESNFTSIQEKVTKEDHRGTSGKRTHEESKKRSHEGRATRRNRRK